MRTIREALAANPSRVIFLDYDNRPLLGYELPEAWRRGARRTGA